MSGVIYGLSAPWRLIRAMRRNGVWPVLNFLSVTLRRRGALAAFRLGLADRRQRVAAAETDLQAINEQRVRPTQSTGAPSDLDEDHTLSEAAWAHWRPWVGLHAPDPDAISDRFDAARLAFVVRDVAGNPEGALRTRRAVERQGGRVLTNGPLAVDALIDIDFVVFLSAGDEPSSILPGEIGRVARRGRTDLVSFDLSRRENGRVQPLLLPGANPTLLGVTDYVFSRVAVRPDLLSPGAPAAQVEPRAVMLEWLERVSPTEARGRWRHIGRPAVEAAINRSSIEQRRQEAIAVGRQPLPPMLDPATVVICTRDRGHLLRQLVRSLLARPPGEIAELVILSNGTSNPYALRTLDDLVLDERVQVLRGDGPFNFSRLCNLGAAVGDGTGPLLFMNDDVAPISEDWLPRLASKLSDPAVGSAGPLLLYPDERVQHAGMYLDPTVGAAHLLRGASLPEMDYLFSAVAAREVSCLTGAVLMVRREAFEAVGGFDDQLATLLQDVDLGLRLRRSGWANVFEPAAVLLHMESTSMREFESRLAFHRGRELERCRFMERWGAETLRSDPYHPAGFDLQRETLRHLSAAGGVRPLMKNGLPESPPPTHA